MPWSQHSCTYPGCGEPLPPGRKGRCDKHPYPDAHDHESQRLYNTQRWKRIRKAQLTKEPWCADCLKESRYTPATIADHIKPHRGDPVKFFTGKLQSLCKYDHDKKTAKEVFGKVSYGGAAKKVHDWRETCGHGQRHEKNSPIETANKVTNANPA
jgi:5-methylcytosine-specific restriction protein A